MTLLLATMFCPRVQAEPAVAQAISLGHAVADEFGHPLKGTEPSSPKCGIPAVEGDLVQILHATDGHIYPPNTDGAPDPRNLLIGTTRIGHGMSPNLPEPARCSAAVTPRPGGNSQIFVRVFNGPSECEASFYADSQLFTVKSWKNEIFTADISSTTQPLDAADDDGDGLNNSWEKSYGSDPGWADTDGDGSADGAEVRAGTDLLDSESVFALADISLVNGQDIRLRWASVAGKNYRIELANGLSENAGEFSEVATVTADGSESEFIVIDGVSSGLRCYRVCVVE